MKTMKPVAGGLLMLGLLLSGGIRGVEAATFLGDFCWQGSEGTLARFGVTDMGGGHYLVHGTVTSDGTVGAANGNAEIVGAQVILTVSFSGENASESWSGTGRFVLSLSNLNGTGEFFELTHPKSSPGLVQLFHSLNTVTSIPCP